MKLIKDEVDITKDIINWSLSAKKNIVSVVIMDKRGNKRNLSY